MAQSDQNARGSTGQHSVHCEGKGVIALGEGEFAGGLDGKNFFLVTLLHTRPLERRRKL